MATVFVDDATDDRLDDYHNIPDSELKERRGIFIAEGRLVIARLLSESPLRTRSVMVTEAARAALADLMASKPELPVFVVAQAVMNGIAGLDIHRGCLAIGERPRPRQWEDVVAGAKTLVVLERIGDADNVGSIFRNAAAFGVQGVLLGPSCADPLYRKAIRTSMGATLLIPFARLEEWPASLNTLRGMGFSLVAMTPHSNADTLQHCADQVRGTNTALLLGHEGEGLSAAAVAACDHRARIPMAAGVDSVNVATASAIALYEFSQGQGGRGQGGKG